jgi:peptidoglycan/xylan/chitin deacetylase (PgdA/CDA1 family)
VTRYLSFRFDDGFFVGALKANAALAPDSGTFFIVTGLVEGTHRLEHIPEFVEREFGTLESWKLLARSGHDIQPHSVTHPHLPLLPAGQQIDEIAGSLAFVRRIHDGPYIFCSRYNQCPDVDFGALGFAAAGFEGSSPALPYNDLTAVDRFALRSQVVFEEEYDRVVEQLRSAIPDEAWVIIGFHSFDGEGHRPWNFDRFAQLVAEIRALDFRIESVASMIRRHA